MAARKNDFCLPGGSQYDMVLLSPNKDGLQKMFNIVKTSFNKLDLIISFDHMNPEKSKTQCLAFGVKK